MRYSGSPLAFSIKEKDHHKSSVLIDIGAEGVPAFQLIPAPVPRLIKELTGTMAELLDTDNSQWADAWVFLRVTDATYPEGMQHRLRERFAYVLGSTYVGAASTSTGSAPIVNEAMSPFDVTTQFVEFVTASAPSEEEAAILRDAYEAVNSRKLTA